MREKLNDEIMEEVVGGHMHWNEGTKVMTYMHEETGAVTQYKCLKFNRAWRLSNTYHAQNMHEDEILSLLLQDGCIKPI